MFDVVVIGGGHAGVEAACAAHRIGAKVALVTMSRENLGEMSCNPAIGGIGKGTIVREIDALDGIMAKAIDLASINSKILNKTKGEAVWGWRAQADRSLYKKATSKIISEYEILGLEVLEDLVEDINFVDNKVYGVRLLKGGKVSCNSVVLCTGTFLEGKIIVGEERIAAGRINEPPSININRALESVGVSLMRLKTGTPPRIARDTINYIGLEEQKSDEQIMPFSFLTQKITTPQISCFISFTNNIGHDVLRNNIHRCPLFNGEISARGPRYCPSIEDKIMRFATRDRHQVFLEPEGLDSNLVYPNGISSCSPTEVQDAFIRTIKGLEKCIVVRYGYAIEYNYIDAKKLKPNLEINGIGGLFFAGQINGTTGYEEAAGQGIVAGINAALLTKKMPPFILPRESSYIGVMIDDLISLGVGGEPYRIFTSRSENRINIRGDNADFRLTPLGIAVGCVGDERKNAFLLKTKQKDQLKSELEIFNASPNKLSSFGIEVSKDGVKKTALSILSTGLIALENIGTIWSDLDDLSGRYHWELIFHLLVEEKYKSFTSKQSKEFDLLKSAQNLTIDESLVFESVGSLSNETIEKLKIHKPKTIGDVLAISGITPAAVCAILAHMKKHKTKIS